MRTFAYFLDKDTFEIKDIAELNDFEKNIDEETNSKTTFQVFQEISASDGDIVVVKEGNEDKYIGVIDAPSNDNGEIAYKITAKYITNIFDRKVILKNESLISQNGIEDFIFQTIYNEFTHSSDTLLNKNFLDIEVLTHTKKQFSVTNENGIYNFYTFMTNCTQNYNIVYDFQIVDSRLKMTIKSIEDNTEDFVDCNVPDIINYNEIFNTKVTAKVTVLCEDKSEHTWYLLNDRTTTENINDENRAKGEIETIYEELAENAKESAMQIFRSNSYSHLIEFDIYKYSELYDISSWQNGKKLKIKNKKGELIQTYISAIKDGKDSSFLHIKTGNIRINFIDKLKQEKNK